MGLLDDAIREHLDLQRRRGADPADIERSEREALGPVRREPASFEDAAAAPVTPSPPEASPSAWDAIPDGGGGDDFLELDGGPVETEAVLNEDATAILPPPTPSPEAAAPPVEDFLPEPGRDLLDEPESEAPSTRGGIAAPDHVEPEFDLHQPKRRRGLFHRHRDPEPEPEPPAVRRIDRSQPINEPAPPPAPAPAAEEIFAEDDDLFEKQVPAGEVPNRPPSLQIGGENLGHTVEYDVEKAFRDEDDPDPAPPVADEDILEETPDFLADTPDHDRLWFEQKPPPDFDFDA